MTTDGPYAEVDFRNATRIGALAGVVVAILALVLLAIGAGAGDDAGTVRWVLADVLVVAALVAAAALQRRTEPLGPIALLVLPLAGVVHIAAVSALAGVPSVQGLMVVWIVMAAAIHPPARVALVLGVAIVLGARPLLTGSVEGTEATRVAADLVVWTGLALLAFVLLGRLRVQRSELRRERALAAEQAERDPLTGLPNRRAFDAALPRELARSRRSASPLALVVLDLDAFKEVNDTFSHIEGDAALRAVADALVDTVRTPDLVFRWAGDEFVLVLPEATAEDAAGVVARVRDAVRDAYRRPDGLPVALSAGIAEVTDDLTPEEALTAADVALVSLKQRAGQTDRPTGRFAAR